MEGCNRQFGFENSQIGTCFRPLGGETGDSDETGYALGSRGPATTNGRFRDFFGSCEIVPPQTSEPRVAGSSPAGRIHLAIQWRSEARRDRDAGKQPAGSSPAGRIAKALGNQCFSRLSRVKTVVVRRIILKDFQIRTGMRAGCLTLDPEQVTDLATRILVKKPPIVLRESQAQPARRSGSASF